MDPTLFVGVPDWRSAALAILFAVPWLWWLGRGRLRSPALWLALLLAAAAFPFVIAWIQVPIQSAIGNFYSAWFGPGTRRELLLVLAVPGLLVASVVQETLKLLAAYLPIRLFGERRRPLVGLAIGAGAGAGFGAFEAFWALNQVFNSGFTWASVQLGGPLALTAFFERFFAVPFHVGTGAINAYGYATRRTLPFWLLSIALHTALNYVVVLLQLQLLDAVGTELWVAAGSLLTIGIAIWLRRRASRGKSP